MRPELNIKNPPGQFVPLERPLTKEVDEYFEAKKKWAEACDLAAKTAPRQQELVESPQTYLEGLLRRHREDGHTLGYHHLTKLLEMLK